MCDKGLKWLAILPEKDYYCITAMMNDKEEILLWYIDMIAEQQYELALQTSENLQNGLLADIEKFKEYTYQYLNLVREN